MELDPIQDPTHEKPLIEGVSSQSDADQAMMEQETGPSATTTVSMGVSAADAQTQPAAPVDTSSASSESPATPISCSNNISSRTFASSSAPAALQTEQPDQIMDEAPLAPCGAPSETPVGILASVVLASGHAHCSYRRHLTKIWT